MTDRTAIVTGSARGIGRSIALMLTDRGLDVVGVDRAPDPEAPFRTLQIDLADPEAVQQVSALCPQADVLVNNAGIAIDRPPEEFSIEDFNLTMAINLRAPFMLAANYAPRMAKSNWGRIINISSTAAHTGGTASNSAIYAASKAGLIAVTKSLARRYGNAGVLVNAIAPGGIATDLVHNARPEELKAKIASEILLHRFGAPDEIAEVVAFLASDASSFITGTTIDVNGGWYVR
jgi:NAD(P)-dependent dehydrogenase (short-subunit alcohol dehydrogenase family)